MKDRYRREAMISAFRILGEGQLALTKFLLVTDARRDLRDFRGLLAHVLARCRFETDLFVFGNLAMDTLDYTGPKVNEGSKGVLMGLGAPVRTLPGAFSGALPPGAKKAAVFCPGALVLEGPSYRDDGDWPSRLAADPAVAGWPLVVLADDAAAAAKDDRSFLWHVFTRFEPAADLHGARRIVRNHVAFTPPVVLDARTKPWMPGVVEPDPATVRQVDARWREFFPEPLRPRLPTENVALSRRHPTRAGDQGPLSLANGTARILRYSARYGGSSLRSGRRPRGIR